MNNKKQQNIHKETKKKQDDLTEKRAANLRANLLKRKALLRERKEK